MAGRFAKYLRRFEGVAGIRFTKKAIHRMMEIDRVLDAPKSPKPIQNMYVSAKGLPYQTWMSDDSRTSATPGDLNDKLAFQMESVMRDVLFRESLLTADTGTDTDEVKCAELAGAASTYYNGAYVQNVTRGEIRKVSSYNASTKTITLASTITGQTAGDLFSVFNIQGSNIINYSSFDTAAATGGLRADWKGAFSLQDTESGKELGQIAQECGLLWFRNYENKETVRPLDAVTQDVTLTSANIAEVEGIPQIRVYKTSTDEIYNDITVNYRPDYVTGGYTESEQVSWKKVSFSDSRGTFRDGYSTYQALCAASFAKYKMGRPLTLNLDHVRDEATAILKLKQLADMYALQRYVVEADLSFSTTTAALEEGDFVMLTHEILPEAVSGAALFLCVSWTFTPSNMAAPYHVILRELPWSVS